MNRLVLSVGLVAAGVVSGLALFGTYSCGPVECETPPEVSVSLESGEEQVRTLPVLRSGAVSIAGQEVPDSHGDVAADATIEGVDSVTVTDVSFEVAIGGDSFPIDIERQLADGEEVDPTGTLSDGNSVRTYFSADNLEDILLPVGENYEASYTLQWEKHFPNGCPPTRSGTAEVTINSNVKATADKGAFAVDEGGTVEAFAPTMTGSAKFRADTKVTSGMEVELQGVRAEVTYFGPPADTDVGGATETANIGFASFDSVATVVGGTTASTVGPNDTLEIYSTTDTSSDPPPYEAGGTAGTVGDISGGKAVIKLIIEYKPTDGTAGVQTSVLQDVVDISS